MAPLAGRPSRPVVGAADCAGWRGGEPTVLFPVAMSFCFYLFYECFWPLSRKALLGVGIFLEPAILLTSLVLKLIILEFFS